MTAPEEMPEIDPRAFRRALGNFATGVTIVTAQNPEGVKVGVTASSFNSLSIDPPLILWSSLKEARSCPIFESSSHFAVNVLASDQLQMSNHFARQQEDKFAEVEWQEGLGGAPVFPNCAARFQCETYDKVDGGDHWIFIGKVVAFDDFGRSPLCFHQGSYSLVFNHPDSSANGGEDSGGLATGARTNNHIFFMMLRAVRAYQASYRPKLEALGIRLIESRCLLMLQDQPGQDAESLVIHANAPITEVQEGLDNLTEQGLITNSGSGFALSAAGQEKAGQIWDIADAHAIEVFKDVDDGTVAGFKTVLRQIIQQR
ncbi:MAG: p-hydroxyphenylacetate 3-hydroxylase reductase component [Rhizobiaceae bacterium]